VSVFDMQIRVWWGHGDLALSAFTRALLGSTEQTGRSVSATSCWEVARHAGRGRLTLPCLVFDWLQQVLSPRICVESTQMPGEFQRAPAGQVVVATARVLDAPGVTVAGKISEYPHVRLTPTLPNHGPLRGRLRAGCCFRSMVRRRVQEADFFKTS
jgi:PIN domain nuclease of toxin-antitoxin system